MNIKSAVVIEVEKGEHTFMFSMPLGCPLGTAYDAAFQVLRDIVELSKNAVEQVKQPDPIEPEIVEKN